MDAEHYIPKIIHYCWFGSNPLPESAVRCIGSWKKYCPDYEIRQWNDRNFDWNSCRYAREAYQAGKWAFVSDYARFKILYEQGGVYLDTDVELLRPPGRNPGTGRLYGFGIGGLPGGNGIGHCRTPGAAFIRRDSPGL